MLKVASLYSCSSKTETATCRSLFGSLSPLSDMNVSWFSSLSLRVKSGSQWQRFTATKLHSFSVRARHFWQHKQEQPLTMWQRLFTLAAFRQEQKSFFSMHVCPRWFIGEMCKETKGHEIWLSHIQFWASSKMCLSIRYLCECWLSLVICRY